MKYHFIGFFQDELLFKPFEKGNTLAEAMLQNLAAISHLIDRVTLVVHPATADALEKLIQRHPEFNAQLFQESKKILRTSKDYPNFLKIFLKDVSELPILILEPESSFLDPETILTWEKWFRESDLLVMAYSSVLGWDARFVSSRRKEVLDLLNQAEKYMDGRFYPLRALHDLRPDVCGAYALQKEPKQLPSAGLPELLGTLHLLLSPFVWTWYASLQKLMEIPFHALNLELLFQTFLKHRRNLQCYPTQIVVEVSTASSAVPVYSPLHYKKEEIQKRGLYMEKNIFQSVLNKIKERSIPPPELIFNCATGDPLSHPRIKEWLEIMLADLPPSSIKTIVFFTYGDGLGPEFAKLFSDFSKSVVLKRIAEKVQIIIRLDAADAGTYSKIRNGLPFEHVMNGIQSLLNEKKSHYRENGLPFKPFTCAMATTLIEETQDHIDVFMRKWPSRASVFKSVSKQIPIGVASPVENKRWIDFWSMKEKQFYTENEPVDYTVIYGPSHFAGQIPVKPVADYAPLKRTACRRLINALTILSDGAVVICDRVLSPDAGDRADHIETHHSFYEIWAENRLKALRGDHIQGVYDSHPLCKKCNDWYIPL